MPDQGLTRPDARWTAVACGLLIAATLPLSAGCTGKQRLSAAEHFKQATQHFRGGALTTAVDVYREMLDQHPFSEYNEEAELKIAHAQYLDGNYAESIVTLTDFQRRHPTSPQLPFVGYILGMCYAKQMGTIDRDQTAAQNAEAYFVTVNQQYPDSPFAELAREQLARCRDSLAAHEVYVAKFYGHAGNDKAQEIRLLTMAARYGESPVAADGLLQLAQIYRRRDEPANATLAYQAVEELHPDAPQARTARRALVRLHADGDPPPADPLDLLLAANGRQRSSGPLEIVKVPGLEPADQRPRTTGPGVGPSIFAPTDPFGGGPFGRRPY